MRKLLLAGVLLVSLAGVARAAEKLEDKSVHVSLEAPEGFIKAPELPKKDSFIGEPKGLYLSPEVTSNGGALLVHHTAVPGGLDYDQFKNAFADFLGKTFASGFKVVKQEDTQVGKFSGFMLEFVCPGDGGKPDPNGTIPHHIRWYFFKDGADKLVGVLYGARDATWNDLEPKYAASFKTLKYAE